MIKYKIQPIPNKHIFEVEINIAKPEKNQILSLPTWIPGSYMIRDFVKNIISLSASANKKKLNVKQLDKTTWQINNNQAELTINYEVYAFDLSVRGAYLDNTRAFFNGSSVFLEVNNFSNEVCQIEIIKPLGKQYKNWRIATALTNKTSENHGIYIYEAKNYDELIDTPVEISDFVSTSFQAMGIEHEVILTGKHSASLSRIKKDLHKLCNYQLQFFNNQLNIKKYVFLIAVLGDENYGGLEHRASCSLHCSRNDLPKTEDDFISDNYRNFLTLCSHEYFHNWMIKRIKPDKFLPYDLRIEAPTNLLWIFEGFTRYYEVLMLVRARIINKESYLKELNALITSLLKTPGRLKQSVAQSSFEAWTKFYKQDANSRNIIISYYTKGALLALILDVNLRVKTDITLDDVVLYLWQEYGLKNTGLKEQEFEQILFNLTKLSWEDFFVNYVYGTKELPLVETLNIVGINCEFAQNASKDEVNQATIGILAEKKPEGLLVKTVLEDSAAEEAGIAHGDLLISIDDIRISENWDKQFANYQVGEEVIIYGFRIDVLQKFTVKFKEAPKNSCILTWQQEENLSKEAKKNRDAWLKIG